jgi:hypothetical protein
VDDRLELLLVLIALIAYFAYMTYLAWFKPEGLRAWMNFQAALWDWWPFVARDIRSNHKFWAMRITSPVFLVLLLAALCLVLIGMVME